MKYMQFVSCVRRIAGGGNGGGNGNLIKLSDLLRIRGGKVISRVAKHTPAASARDGFPSHFAPQSGNPRRPK